MTNDFEKMKETVVKLNGLLQTPEFGLSSYHMFVRERLQELHNQIHKYFGLKDGSQLKEEEISRLKEEIESEFRESFRLCRAHDPGRCVQ